MSSHPYRFFVAAAVMLICAGAANGGDSRFQQNYGGVFFSSATPCKAKDVPTFESLVPVPAIIDPFEQDVIPGFCQIFASNKGNQRKNVRGKYETSLVLIDNNTGMAESFPIGSGKFRTDENGRDSFDFDLPSELFADGFESGDVSAWSYTRTDFTRNRRVDHVQQSCDVGSSSSSSN